MKLNIMWHALNGGIMYKVRTVNVGNEQYHVWRTWNIPMGISKYGVSNTDRTPSMFYDCNEQEVFSLAIGDAYNDLALSGDDTRAQVYYEAFIRGLMLASHQYMKEVSR